MSMKYLDNITLFRGRTTRTTCAKQPSNYTCNGGDVKLHVKKRVCGLECKPYGRF